MTFLRRVINCFFKLFKKLFKKRSKEFCKVPTIDLQYKVYGSKSNNTSKQKHSRK